MWINVKLFSSPALSFDYCHLEEQKTSSVKGEQQCSLTVQFEQTSHFDPFLIFFGRSGSEAGQI